LLPIIDIHCHIIPGVDDGSENMETSIEMMRMAYEAGTRGMIVTPHYKPRHRNAELDTINELISKLQGECKKRGIKIKLYPGNELYYHLDLVNELEERRANTLASSNYVLIEFNPGDMYEKIRDGLYSSLSYGYMPILAHVERYENVMKNIDRVRDLINLGCYIQVNSGSVMGEFGFTTKRNVKKLLKEELVHFIASDAHGTGRRNPDMSSCAEYIAKKYGEDYKRQLFSINPAKVIKNVII